MNLIKYIFLLMEDTTIVNKSAKFWVDIGGTSTSFIELQTKIADKIKELETK
jgi:hypothetical protein